LGALVLLPPLAAAPAAGREVPAAQIARWVAGLGSRKYVERRAAERALDALGARGLAALDAARKNPDAEVRRRAGQIAGRIRKRLERDRLLTATRVRLSYGDTPLSEAVVDLAKKSGYPFRLTGDAGKWNGRKVTVDTGPTTFWRAFDEFCAKAGVAEQGLALAGRWVGVLPARRFDRGAGGRADPAFVLIDHRARPLATDYRGGLRVRALPASIRLSRVPNVGQNRILILEAAVEFRTRLRDLAGLRLRRTLDAEGSPVRASAHLLREQANVDALGNPFARGIVPAYVRQLENGMQEGNFRRGLVFVPPGKKLRALEGTLLLELEKPAGPVVTVRDVLKADGKSFSVPGGGSMTLTSVQRGEGGKVTLDVETQFALGGFIGGIRIMNGVVQVRRNLGNTWETIGLRPDRLKLLDAAGRSWQQAAVRNSGLSFGPGVTQRFNVTYLPAKGQAAARLVYYGIGTTVVEVPFALKDVPLE
jgi:hypothetical protein